ncbi:MAG: DegV family protein [Collinsella sp.]
MDKAASAGHSNRCRIVVDTCCDFSPEVAANLDVDILGFPFIIDGEERTDDIWSSMSPKEFYDRMRAGARVSTSAVSLGRYIEFFTECAKRARPRSTCALPRRCRRATTPRARRRTPCAPSIRF